MIRRFFNVFLRRFFRRLRHTFRFHELWSWEYESCERCGAAFMIAYSVRDDKWRAVYGSELGTLCLDCFLRLAEARGVNLTLEHFEWLCLFHLCKPIDITSELRDFRNITLAARSLVEHIRELEGDVPDSALLTGAYGPELGRLLEALKAYEEANRDV